MNPKQVEAVEKSWEAVDARAWRSRRDCEPSTAEAAARERDSGPTLTLNSPTNGKSRVAPASADDDADYQDQDNDADADVSFAYTNKADSTYIERISVEKAGWCTRSHTGQAAKEMDSDCHQLISTHATYQSDSSR